MGRIGANLSGIELRLLNKLAEANAAATLNALRLTTGAKINSPSDNPSGFIALSQFQSDLANVNSTLANINAASSLVSQVQLALDQVRTQLNTIRTKALADADQSLTADERAANQAAIDDAITEINRLAASDIAGRRLLDGSANFNIQGASNSQVRQVEVYSLGDSTGQTISGQVTTPAQRAVLTHTEGTGLITADGTFTLSGDRGSSTISVETGDTLSEVADRINLESHLTGVTASVTGNDLKLSSINYGSQAEVEIDVTSGAFAVTGGNGDGTANGVDAVATINGEALTGEGNRFEVNRNSFYFAVEFQGGFSGTFNSITAAGSALTFALSPDLAHKATLAVPGVQAARLGGLSGTLDQLASGGSLSGLGTNAPAAVRVVDEALAQLTLIDGRVDGFADATIASSSALENSLKTKLVSSIDAINKVDDEEESMLLAKNRALADNALASLTILSNQRASIVALIQKIAGLA